MNFHGVETSWFTSFINFYMESISMSKRILITLLSSTLFIFSNASMAVPPVTGKPVVVQHLGKLEWPADRVASGPYLTQLAANDINDLHGDVACELIISTPGNYSMALKDAMYGEAILGHVGLIEQQGTPSQFKVSICWTTSPPISVKQIPVERVQFKNIDLVGRPSLVMAPGGVMNTLVADGLVDETTRQPFLVNKGNVILIRADKVGIINDICDLGGTTRVVTPSPSDEPGSFANFSGTIFNVAKQNSVNCIAEDLFASIFDWTPAGLDLSLKDFPYNIDGVMSIFGRGSAPQGSGAKWVASSRIMHRDIPYALCHDEADAAVIFYHQAKYITSETTVKDTQCHLAIVPLGGDEMNPNPSPGNKVGTLHIAKVNGTYAKKVNDARDKLYNFFTTNPIWGAILEKHGMIAP